MENKRERIIISLIKEGNTYTEIGDMFKVTKQRIHQIAERNNLSAITIRKKLTDKKCKKLIRKLRKDISYGLTTNEIIKKHKLNNPLIQTLRAYGMNIYQIDSVLSASIRKKINELYMQGMTASAIIKIYPKYQTQTAVYNIVKKYNNGCLPNRINTRDVKLNLIKDNIKVFKNDNLSIEEISNKLAELNIYTSRGTKITNKVVEYHYNQL